MISPGATTFLRRWLINTLGVLLAANVVQGIQCDSIPGLLAASLLLGIFNAVLKPILVLFSLPFLLFSLGLFLLVINAILLYLVGWLVKPFHVNGFWAAFWGALIISLVSHLANRLTGQTNIRATVRRGGRGQPPDHDRGQGPVIDV
jgi:putative membrane protein